MENVAFIPVRGGSKSIPLKNIKMLNGKPLVYWVISAAEKCQFINKIYVSTDSERIKDVVESFCFSKCIVISRSMETATDEAPTETAMLEFANQYEFDNIALIQATSPLLETNDLDNGFSMFLSEKYDSVLSVVEQKRFNWNVDNESNGYPINYDYHKRPRRQDFLPYFTENGAFYITSKKRLLEFKNRLSGAIGLSLMSEDTLLEIDEPSDFVIIEAIMKNKMVTKNRPNDIKMFVTDVDGCLTDGGMYYSSNGIESKKFNTYDGLAISKIMEQGIIVCVITSENTTIVENRCKKLNIKEVHQGVIDKKEMLQRLCDKYSIELKNVLYCGDDLNDLQCIINVGWSCCPANANNIIKNNCDYVSSVFGGNGFIRDVFETFLKK